MKLGDFIELKRGYDLPKKRRVAGSFPVVSSSGITDWHAEAKVAAPGVVTGRYGTIGNVYYLAEDFWPLNTALYVRDFKGADPRFVAYFLRTLDFHAYSDKAAVPGVNRNHLHLAKVRVPPTRAEQEAIAAILGALDEKIESNRRINETLNEMAEALFRAWFVDFNPAQELLQGGSTDLPSHLEDQFSSELTPSDVGPIPAGWRTATLGERAKVMIGGDWGQSEKSEGLLPVRCLRGVDIHSLRTKGWADAPIRYVKEASLSKRAPTEADLIVEASGHCGRTLQYSTLLNNLYSEDVIYTNFCKRFRLPSPEEATYIEHLLNDMVTNKEMQGYITGTAMPNLDYKGLLAGKKLVVPPQPLLEAFAKFVRQGRERLFSHENLTLTNLRDTLLPKLMSGEVRVPETERLVSEVT